MPPQTEQYLDLLLQLKKTTPVAAKNILNAQPQIAYGLIKLLVEMDAVDIQVFQRILADYGAQQQAAAASTPSVPPTPTPVYQAPAPHIQAAPRGYATPPQPGYPTPGYGRPPAPLYPPQLQQHSPTYPPAVNPMLASLPDEQKQMILALLAMSPEQINGLPPNERASAVQLRATFGGQ